MIWFTAHANTDTVPIPVPTDGRPQETPLRVVDYRGVHWADLKLRFALTPTLSLQERGLCKGLRGAESVKGQLGRVLVGDRLTP